MLLLLPGERKHTQACGAAFRCLSQRPVHG